jgi:4-aminobutyrate--pyruvate transaminase
MNIASPLKERDTASVLHPQTNPARHMDSGPLVISKGSGVYVYDDNDNEYIDGASSLWCASLGYSSERLAKVAYDQMTRLGSYNTFRHMSNESSIALSEKLISIAPVPMSKVLLQCSGSEANDTAIKLVWYYFSALGKPEKRKIIGREKGYHGSSCAAISVSGKPDMHQGFGLPLDGFLHTKCPHYWRERLEGETEEAFSTRMAGELEKLILAEGPDTVAAFFAEPIMGAGGAVFPPKTYFEKIQAVLKKYDVLFVVDEVICGFGRTGNMWGSQTFGLKPDMVSCAKALSAGMIPISALLINDKIFQAILAQGGSFGNFAHGYTYAGHPVAAAVALETLKIYEEDKVFENVRSRGEQLSARLEGFANYEFVGSVDSVGLIAGIEIFDRGEGRGNTRIAKDIASRLDKKIRENGLILRVIGNRITLAPPLIIGSEDLEELLRRLDSAFQSVSSDLRLA